MQYSGNEACLKVKQKTKNFWPNIFPSESVFR